MYAFAGLLTVKATGNTQAIEAADPFVCQT
ncbi:hypothetical protein FAIPA1_110115 [Frankia sp. AiPs1]